MITPEVLLAQALLCTPADIPAECALGQHPRWDSFAHVRLLMLLEEHYGVSIDNDAIGIYHSLSALRSRYHQLIDQEGPVA